MGYNSSLFPNVRLWSGDWNAFREVMKMIMIVHK
jgi:hypothetical protein